MHYDGIEGKRVVVTAAGSGIGAQVARRFAGAAARVFVCDVDAGSLSAIRAADPGIGAAVADVAVPAAVDRFFDEALSSLGGLDILVNNAGIAGPAAPVEEMSVEDFRLCVDVNLTGAFLCVRRAVPAIKAAGGGSIILMSSNAGTMGLPFRAPYVATKWGVVGLMKTLAMELGPHNVRVNAMCPGDVEGDRIRRVITMEAENRGMTYDDVVAERVQAVSLRTMVTADDVADMMLFLCSDAGAKVSGQAVLVDGNAERA